MLTFERPSPRRPLLPVIHDVIAIENQVSSSEFGRYDLRYVTRVLMSW
jgi:hypothetical protein